MMVVRRSWAQPRQQTPWEGSSKEELGFGFSGRATGGQGFGGDDGGGAGQEIFDAELLGCVGFAV